MSYKPGLDDNSVFSRMNRPQGPFMYDAFSDYRDSFLDSLGINQKAREALQPVVNQASSIVTKSLLPQGGAIPEAQGLGAFSNVTTTAKSFLDKLLAPKVGGVPVVPLALIAVVILWLKFRK